MADLSELLSSSNPEALQKLLALRDQLNSQSSQAPYDAAEASSQASQPISYDKLFGQNAVMQDQLAPQNLANKSAAESADVLKAAPEYAPAETKTAMEASDIGTPLLSEAEEASTPLAEALAGGAGRLASRAAGPLTALLMPNDSMVQSSGKMTAVPGMPHTYFSGQDLVRVPQDQSSTIKLSPDLENMISGNSSSSSKEDILADLLAHAKKQSSSDNEDEDEETPSVNTKSSTSTKIRGPASVQPANLSNNASQPQQNVLASLMDKLYGPGAGDRLTDAQNAQKQILSANALNMAGKEIAAAMSRGGYKPNYASNEQVAQTAGLPVQQEMQQRGVVKDALDSGMKMADFQDKQALTDAKSPLSEAYRNMAATLTPMIAKTPGFENMSAEAIKQAQPMVDTYMKAQMIQLQRQQMNQQKTDQRQQQSFNQTVQQLEQMRGSPAVSQAEKDLYASQKAQTLTKMFGDPNNMSPQMTALFTQEVAKIAQGGVPTHDEMAMLTPNALQGKLASVWSKLSNNPTPANAGAFIKQYQDYAQGVAQDAQKVIEDRYGRVINTKKSQFNDDQNQYLKDNYLNRFKSAAQGTVRMFDPQGNLREIPSDMVDAALKNGGKLAQ